MTKKQRHVFYKKLLKEVCKDPSTLFGLCFYIDRLPDYYIEIYNNKEFETHLPELWGMKPKHKNTGNPDYWFHNTPDGWKKRIALIEQCIELTS